MDHVLIFFRDASSYSIRRDITALESKSASKPVSKSESTFVFESKSESKSKFEPKSMSGSVDDPKS